MAQRMFKMASEPQTDIRSLRPDLPECLVAIINHALTKDPEQRFQTGGEMARELRACLQVASAATTGRPDVRH